MKRNEKHLNIVHTTTIQTDSSDESICNGTDINPEINNGDTGYMECINEHSALDYMKEIRLRVLQQTVLSQERRIQDISYHVGSILEVMQEVADMLETGHMNEPFIRNKLIALIESVNKAKYFESAIQLSHQ